MALPPFEIRYKKSAIYFVFGVCGFIFIGTTYMLFFSGVAQTGFPVYSSYLLTLLVMGTGVFLAYKRFKDPRPALVFSSEGLLFPRKKDRFIPWGAVTEWKIRRYKNTRTLVVRTVDRRTSIDINWLDIPVKRIEELMAMYIRQPGCLHPTH